MYGWATHCRSGYGWRTHTRRRHCRRSAGRRQHRLRQLTADDQPGRAVQPARGVDGHPRPARHGTLLGTRETPAAAVLRRRPPRHMSRGRRSAAMRLLKSLASGQALWYPIVPLFPYPKLLVDFALNSRMVTISRCSQLNSLRTNRTISQNGHYAASRKILKIKTQL
jgi:hypothetical protein